MSDESRSPFVLTLSELHELERVLEEERSTSQHRQDRVDELKRSLEDANERVGQQQQTITLLVSEKTSLSASLERLQDADTRTYSTFNAQLLTSALIFTSHKHT